jgi:hypothetical protein
VYLLKKVQLILGELYVRFHDDAELSSLFNFTDISHLTVFSDNVLPAVLRAKGVLVYSDELSKVIDSETVLKDKFQEASVRAGAVVAADEIVKLYNEEKQRLGDNKNDDANTSSFSSAHAEASSSSAATSTTTDTHPSSIPSTAAPLPPLSFPSSLTAAILDYHLWLGGKEPELRKLPRHASHSPFY